MEDKSGAKETRNGRDVRSADFNSVHDVDVMYTVTKTSARTLASILFLIRVTITAQLASPRASKRAIHAGRQCGSEHRFVR